MGKYPAFFSGDVQAFHVHRQPLHRQDDILEALGVAHQSAVLEIPKLRVRRTDPTSRSRDPFSKYIAGDRNHLPDLVAAISELRHSATFAASAIENVLRLVAVPDKWGSRIPNWRATVVLQSPNLRRPTISRHASWAPLLLISQGGAATPDSGHHDRSRDRRDVPVSHIGRRSQYQEISGLTSLGRRIASWTN